MVVIPCHGNTRRTKRYFRDLNKQGKPRSILNSIRIINSFSTGTYLSRRASMYFYNPDVTIHASFSPFWVVETKASRNRGATQREVVAAYLKPAFNAQAIYIAEGTLPPRSRRSTPSFPLHHLLLPGPTRQGDCRRLILNKAPSSLSRGGITL
jgi:hypothetical protein